MFRQDFLLFSYQKKDEPMQKASIVMPIYPGQKLDEKVIKNALKQTIDEIELIVLDTRSEEERKAVQDVHLAKSDPRIYYWAKEFKNTSSLMNFAIEVAKSPYLVNHPYGVNYHSDTVSEFLEVMYQNPQCAMVFSDYTENDAKGTKIKKELYAHEGDTSENWDYGHVRMYRIEYLDKVGRYDESFSHVEEYDLRLKLDDHYSIEHIKKSLYDYSAVPVETTSSALTAKLHTKDAGKLGAFTYLFENKDKSFELERACKDMLRRRGAYLYRENEEVKYPKNKKWAITVSVIIPCYNRVKYVGKAIDSVLRQSYKDFEIVVVDNGSKDGSIEAVETYCKKDKRIRLIKNAINVIAVSLNKGLKGAKGKYYAQLDSDDEYAPDCLKNMVNFLETHPKSALAISYYQLIDEQSNIIPDLGTIDHLEYDRNNIMRVGGAGALRVYHREVILKEFGGFDEKEFGNFGEDYDLNLKISEKYDIGKVHAVCYYYRRHADNTDVIRAPYLKLHNKALARVYGIRRRQKLNQQLEKQRELGIKKNGNTTKSKRSNR